MIMLLVFVFALNFAKAHTAQFFRRDYTYLQEFDAFYKVHWIQNGSLDSWNTAFTTCYDEGAQLFYPKAEGEFTSVKTLIPTLSKAPSGKHFARSKRHWRSSVIETDVDVIVGIHDEIGDGEFTTVDGKVIPKPVLQNLPMTAGHGCVLIDVDDDKYKTGPCDTEQPSKRLFICKKVDNRPCSTIDVSYTYKEETKKCYKINSISRSWQDAWHTCYIEGGTLVTIDSYAEADLIKYMIKTDTEYFSG
ncbi:hypothetical protein O0L34_g13743 [Tuta absoluta]|nr:hypothetical protein O0L34_g13743 [Tuta absoluta]